MTTAERLLVVQDLDTRLDQLTHRRASLPERARIAEADQVLATVESQIAAQEGVVADCSRERRRTDDELATQEARAADLDAKLYGGGVSGARELQDLQNELDIVRRHVSGVEDTALEALERLEAEEARLGELQAMRDEILERRSEAEAALTVAAAEIDAEADDVSAQRAEAVGPIEGALLTEYEELRASLGGVGVARLVGNRCEGCHLNLPAVEIDRIRHLPDDAPVHCDECGRLLVR